MESIKNLLSQAQELDAQAKQKAEELRELKNQKSDIAYSNLKNIVLPFAKEYLYPVHRLYLDVVSRNRDKQMFHDWYYVTEYMFRLIVGGDLRQSFILNNQYCRLMVLESCSYSTDYVFDDSEEKDCYFLHHYARSHIDVAWFDVIGTVEQAQEICDKLKDIALMECERLMTMLTEENSELSSIIEIVKSEIESASTVEVSEGQDSVKLILNGKEYNCIPVEN